MTDGFRRTAWNSTLRVREYLKRHVGLTRKTPLRPKNPDRAKERWERAFHSRERVRWVSRRPCLVCGRRPSQNAHVKSRAAGGTYRDVVPLCRYHHRRQHEVGIETFQGMYTLDLAAEARRVDDEWEQR